MHGSRHFTAKELAEAMDIIDASIRDPVSKGLKALLYTPDSRLDGYVSRIKSLAKSVRSTKRRQKLGYLLEELCFLAFQGLAGYDTIKSYQSAAPQIDLLINGSDSAWVRLCKTIHISDTSRGMFVEAKAGRGKTGDPELERMCAVLQVHLPNTTALGVLVSLSGITGAGGRSLSDAALTQVLFYARTGKPIVVLDVDDLDRLLDPGGLVRLLEEKIRSIEEKVVAGSRDAPPFEVVLPARLKALSRDL